MAKNPSQEHRPEGDRPHKEEVPFGSLGLGGQGRESKGQMVDGV